MNSREIWKERNWTQLILTMLWSNLAINGVRKCSNNGEKEDHLGREMGRYSGNFRGFSSDCFHFL